jgi:hypothetical protein
VAPRTFALRGEIIPLDAYGSMRANLNRNTEGEAITLDMSRKRTFTEVFATNHGTDDRPNLRFFGQWQNPNLVLTDTGTLSYAFQPDGTVHRGHDPKRQPPKETVPLTLKPGSYADFKASCLPPPQDLTATKFETEDARHRAPRIYVIN